LISNVIRIFDFRKFFFNLLLARAANEQQTSHIGNQAGGRVFLFLYTDDFQSDFQNLLDQGIEIVMAQPIIYYD
jgi:hypothetical protein